MSRITPTTPTELANIKSVILYLPSQLTKESATVIGIPHETAIKDIRRAIEQKLHELEMHNTVLGQHKTKIASCNKELSLEKSNEGSAEMSYETAKKEYDTATQQAEAIEKIARNPKKSRAKQNAKNKLNALYQDCRLKKQTMDKKKSALTELTTSRKAKETECDLYSRLIKETESQINRLTKQIASLENNLAGFNTEDEKQN